MTRLIGVLSWYDEPVEALAQCVTGLRGMGADHLVAVDGRYALFPGVLPVSAEEEQRTVVQVAKTLRMGCTLHVPPHEWLGGEVEKRTHMFALAVAEAQPDDWLVVMDADHVAVKAPADLKEQLAAAEEDVAILTIHDINVSLLKAQDPVAAENYVERFGMRCLFRAQPIFLDTNHHTYITATGKVLFAATGEKYEEEPALDLRGAVVVEHRPGVRDKERQDDKALYYTRRERKRVERGRCNWRERNGEQCPEDATKRVPYLVRRTAQGLNAKIAEMCEYHAARSEQKVAARLRTWGLLCACDRSIPADNGYCVSCHKPRSSSQLGRWVEGYDPAPA